MYSYVCVLSTNNYLEGVLVLNENLKQLKSQYPLLCLINKSITEETRRVLEHFNIQYKECLSMFPNHMNDNTRWKYTFDKLNLFSLTEYKKIVYLDCDFLILENLDHLFEIDTFSMVSNFRQDLHCSALMVIKPNLADYYGLVNMYEEEVVKTKMINVGDQDVLNNYFKDINVIPIEYNFIKGIETEKNDFYDYIRKKTVQMNGCKDFYPSWEPKIIHYYGDLKPFELEDEFDDEYCHLYFYYLAKIRKIMKEFIDNNNQDNKNVD